MVGKDFREGMEWKHMAQKFQYRQIVSHSVFNCRKQVKCSVQRFLHRDLMHGQKTCTVAVSWSLHCTCCRVARFVVVIVERFQLADMSLSHRVRSALLCSSHTSVAGWQSAQAEKRLDSFWEIVQRVC